MTDGREHGRRFGPYTLVEIVGAGATAQVWSARGRSDEGERVAIKILHAPLTKNTERELASVAAIEHPGVVRVIDVVHEGEHIGLVMELCRGSLADWLRVHGPLPAYWVARVGLDALAGLDAAHTAGVLHRDIKPGNLLVAQDGTVKLADFGIAKVLEDEATGNQTSALWGTMPFVAPERRYCRPVDARSDLYGMATTLAYLAVGEVVGELFVPAVRERLVARLPGSLCEVLVRAGAYAPDERFPDAASMASALRRILDELPGRESIRLADLTPLPRLDTHAPTDPVERPTARPARLGLLVSLGASLGVGVALGGLVRNETVVRAPEPLALCPNGSRSARAMTQLGPRETVDGVVADLDQDGSADMVFVNQLDETLSVYWGGSTKLLADPTTIRVGRSSSRPAIGDVDGDGRLDMIVPHTDDAQFLLLRGRPERSFAPGEPIFQAPPPGRLALVDWDADGNLDLLFQTNVNDRCTAWRRGRGDGTFEPHQCIGPESNLLQPYGSHPPAVYRRSNDGMLLRHVRAPSDALGPSEEIADLARFGATGRSTVLVRDLDSDESDEVYILAANRMTTAVIRMDLDGSACEVLSRLDADASWMIDVYDVDADGVLDVLLRATCQGCESNHMLRLGVQE